VARRQAARTWRRRVGEPVDVVPLEELAAAAGLADDAADPERLAAAAQDHERLHRALARLAEAVREVIVLRDLEGFSGPEVASLLGVELGAVKSRLHRARLRLMAELGGEGGADVAP
jgi:RNA polymerase sigma-70 factor (ECF subfamily)